MKCCIEGKSENVGADLVSARNNGSNHHFGQAQGLPLQFLWFSFLNAPLWACPFCSDNVTSGMAKGFYWSILLMVAVPFLVVGTIAGVLWRAGRKKGGLRDAPRG
jgi:hypothetical protein